jgi:hypothetical protein
MALSSKRKEVEAARKGGSPDVWTSDGNGVAPPHLNPSGAPARILRHAVQKPAWMRRAPGIEIYRVEETPLNECSSGTSLTGATCE